MLLISFSEWVLYFAIYSFIGWICESIWCSIGAQKLINRGFLTGPWCPVYGFGAIIVLLTVSPFRAYPPLVFLAAMALTSGLEYFTGWLLETLFKARWWDYSKERFQIKGRVCLRNSVLFGVLGVAVVYFLHPLFSQAVARLDSNLQRISASAIVAALFFDLVKSLAATSLLQEKLNILRSALADLEQYQQDYGWYNRKDLTGSVERLRAICQQQPENTAIVSALERIDSAMHLNLGSARIARAFPKFSPNHLTAEFEALLDKWGILHPERSRLPKLWRMLKANCQKEFAAAVDSYKGITLTRMVWVFLIGSVIGYIVETAFFFATTGRIESRQGMIYGPFNQVYGLGAVAMVLLLSPFTKKNWLCLFFGSGIVGGLFEALCSVVQEFVFGSVSWNYSAHRFPLLGARTGVLPMIAWGLLGVIYMTYIYPRMTSLIDLIPKPPKRFFTWVIIVFLAANLLISALAVNRWSERISGIPAQNNTEQWLDGVYTDNMLKEIYPNMHFTQPSSK